MSWIAQVTTKLAGLFQSDPYRERTDAECHAWYHHGRERPNLKDVAEALYSNWGVPASDVPLTCFGPDRYEPVFWELAREALEVNRMEATSGAVDRLMSVWYDVAVVEEAGQLLSLEHVRIT